MKRALLFGVMTVAVALAAMGPAVARQTVQPGELGEAPVAPSALAEALGRGQAQLWDGTDRGEVARAWLAQQNPEWDLMSRTFTLWALANMAIAEPDVAPTHLALFDRIMEDTLQREAAGGQYVFLMPYAKWGDFAAGEPGSIFVDGELSLALGLRRLARDDGRWTVEHRLRTDAVVHAMQASPLRTAESYPNEHWLFCNTVALAATAVADAVGPAHPARARLREEWLERSAKFRHAESGLFISSWDALGGPIEGPEGSSIFLSAHMLQIVAPELAREQYALAARELGEAPLGLGYAHEWPASWRDSADVDAGQVVPGLDASPSASGLAVVAARAFGDTEWEGALWSSLDWMGGKTYESGALHYTTAGPMGDAVLFYAAAQGPAWAEVRARLVAAQAFATEQGVR